MSFQINKKIIALAATVFVLAGCAGTKVIRDGTTDQPVWPKWDSVNLIMTWVRSQTCKVSRKFARV